MQFIDSFIKRKKGEEEIIYDHPLLEPILNETYGIIVYQEQIMKMSFQAPVPGGFLGEFQNAFRWENYVDVVSTYFSHISRSFVYAEEAIVCIKLQRDTEAEDESERNTTYFTVDKNRPFAKLGKAGSVYYDPETTILEEVSFQVWR